MRNAASTTASLTRKLTKITLRSSQQIQKFPSENQNRRNCQLPKKNHKIKIIPSVFRYPFQQYGNSIRTALCDTSNQKTRHPAGRRDFKNVINSESEKEKSKTYAELRWLISHIVPFRPRRSAPLVNRMYNRRRNVHTFILHKHRTKKQ